jgi:hypothetical protein
LLNGSAGDDRRQRWNFYHSGYNLIVASTADRLTVRNKAMNAVLRDGPLKGQVVDMAGDEAPDYLGLHPQGHVDFIQSKYSPPRSTVLPQGRLRDPSQAAHIPPQKMLYRRVTSTALAGTNHHEYILVETGI